MHIAREFVRNTREFKLRTKKQIAAELESCMSRDPREPNGNSTDLGVRFEPLLDSDEAADLLKIHPKTLQRMARRGEVVGIRIGKLWRFRASELNEWLQRIAG